MKHAAFKTVGFKDFSRRTARLKKGMVAGVDEALESLASKARNEARIRLLGHRNIATKTLYDSLEIRKVAFWTYEMGTPLDYGVWVEKGTRPHWPPLKPLVEWSKAKHNYSEEEAHSHARAVQRTISEKGTKPYPYIRPAHEAIRKIVASEIAKAVRHSVLKGRSLWRTGLIR